ncbi:SyrP-like protein [Pedobacter cryoconitis]|uniref:SyrP-like protein n=1 Tax=Pedobacter cryoconitis TaxID=188932 RepID=A0A127VCP9_9SPHI|nr:TauD/TfdA family dioxygenase [Pedobacter cryoconitis]AMP99116.1 SyrP-like protein [Pedobacter cryoconitis]
MNLEIINKEEDFFGIIEESWAGPEEFIEWFNHHEEEIEQYLVKYGVIRFKKTGLKTNVDFQKFIAEINIKPLDYIDGNSPRTKKSSKIYTSTEYPAEVFISMHNELSYSNYFPKKIFFFCLTPAEEGGETTALNGYSLLEKLDPAIMGDFFDRNIKYIRNLHGGSGIGASWQETFESDDKAFIEAFCLENEIKISWKENNSLRLEQVRPAVLEHPKSGRKIWFNQADQFHPSNNPPEVYEAMKYLYEEDEFPLYVTYEDGSEIPESIFEHIRSVSRANLIALPWEKEDIMLFDNMSVLHGRNPFSGKREILLSMA